MNYNGRTMAISPVYTVKETAKYLHTSMNTVYDEIKANRLPHIRVSKKYLINEDGMKIWWELKVKMIIDFLTKIGNP
jgi:excisionase family DNA binding protein